jgi:hypothetical protein
MRLGLKNLILLLCLFWASSPYKGLEHVTWKYRVDVTPAPSPAPSSAIVLHFSESDKNMKVIKLKTGG